MLALRSRSAPLSTVSLDYPAGEARAASAKTTHPSFSQLESLCGLHSIGQPPQAKPVAVLADRIATARCIIDAQRATLLELRASGQPTFEAEAKLWTYVSSLEHLLAHEDKFREEALVKKGETKKVH